MTATGQNPATVERMGRLVLRFVDLSGDLERNRNDTAFAQDYGSVTYALDAGVLEVFLNCRDGRGRSASLHTGDWRVGGQASSVWDSYAAQTALVATDYLLGGHLPGQQDGDIYMSVWHRREMVRRLNFVMAGQSARVTRNFGHSQTRFEQVLRQLLDGTGDLARRPDLVDEELLRDVQTFRSSARPQESELKAFSKTRLALKVIAEDQTFEPFHQMERLVTDPIRGRIRTLEGILSVSQVQVGEMAQVAGQWFKALLDECGLHGIRVVTRDESEIPEDQTPSDEATRTTGALWDDARTMALMQWAATRRPRQDRLVFVTADNVVFDAYRRWYANLETGKPSSAEPFFMRRLRQFAPGYNLINAGLAHGGRFREIFDEMARGLALMSVPLALSRPHSSTRSMVADREREKTALRLVDRNPIAADPRYRSVFEAIAGNGMDELGARFTELLDNWRSLERAALGQARDEVQRRMRAADSWRMELSADLEEHGAFERLVTKVVDRIVDGTLKVTLLFARDVIERWRPPAGRNNVRAPIALRMPLQLERKVDLGAALMKRLEQPSEDLADGAPQKLVGAEDWPLLFKQPEMVFAIASALSIAGGDWGEAVNFAGYATQIVRRKPHDEAAIEVLYLAALAKRLRIGDIGPARTQKRANEIRTLLQQACELNNECIAYHRRTSDLPNLLELRSYSERAACWLFFASALNGSIAAASEPDAGLESKREEHSTLTRAEARAALEDAEDDLRRCFGIDRIEVDGSDENASTFKRRLRRQIYTNAAFAYLLRDIWGIATARESLFSIHNPRALERARDLNLQERGESVMAADIHAFLALSGDRRAARSLAEMPDLRRSPSVLRLDVCVIRTLKELLREANVGPH